MTVILKTNSGEYFHQNCIIKKKDTQNRGKYGRKKIKATKRQERRTWKTIAEAFNVLYIYLVVLLEKQHTYINC